MADLEEAFVSWTRVGLWRPLTDWLYDPQRRLQVFWKIVEVGVGILVALAVFSTERRKKRTRAAAVAMVVAAVAGGVLASWLLYEMFLVRLRLAGPYWERGPVPGTNFRYR
jgi:hypothetical protein